MRSAFHHEPRQRLSPQERAKLFLERGGMCHRCTRTIPAGDSWIDEHLVALENGGTNEWSNRVLTCSWCKPAKDSEDHKKAAHAKRVATRHVVPSEQRKSRRGFRKAPSGYDTFNRRWRDE